MDAKIPYEVMSTDEHDRLAALYGPLTDDVRELIRLALRTDADPDSSRCGQNGDPGGQRCAAEQRSVTSRSWCVTRSGDARWCGATP